MLINDLLSEMLLKRASDLHISTDNPPYARIDGDIVKLDDNILHASDIANIVNNILSEEQKKFFDSNKEIDLAISHSNQARFRVNIFTTSQGVAAVFRAIPTKIATLEDLNSPEIFKQLCMAPRGLVLVTGPTGSGKSTTLAAMINYINDTQQAHILTIEDPIEFIHGNKKSIINQREVKLHTASFENALRSSLREDPDVILVGEMRDLETIRLALTAAETGHLVFATLHTTGSIRTIDRIVDVFPGNEKDMIRKLLSESLNAVISQVLLKHKSGKGRLAAFEIMITTHAIRNLIRENKLPQITSNLQTGQQYGMQTLELALGNLVKKNLLDADVAKKRLNALN